MDLLIDELTLRALNNEDGKTFFDLIDRNRIYLTDYFPQTIAIVTSLAACANYIVKKMDEKMQRENFSFVLEDAGGALQGYISIKNIDWNVPKCELAYFIDRDHSGKGIMTKVLSAIVCHCFDILRMNKVFLITAMDNYSSRKIAEKNGFEIEGVLRSNFKLATGKLVDMVYYGILSTENN